MSSDDCFSKCESGVFAFDRVKDELEIFLKEENVPFVFEWSGGCARTTGRAYSSVAEELLLTADVDGLFIAS